MFFSYTFPTVGYLNYILVALIMNNQIQNGIIGCDLCRILKETACKLSSVHINKIKMLIKLKEKEGKIQLSQFLPQTLDGLQIHILI